MIFVTGDTHGGNDIKKLYDFAAQTPDLTKDDYMIIAGDFGAVWSRKTLEDDLNMYSALPFSVLFVDGNHENFYLLNDYPVTEWMGGRAHIIRPDIIHLMRGQVFTLQGRTFFTFGGATSADKFLRREGVSWWPEEAPAYREICEGLENLKKYSNKVDYVITHSCDLSALLYKPMRSRTFQTDIYPENRLLAEFENILTYKHWYFGHYHMDGDINGKKTVVYNKIIKLD